MVDCMDELEFTAPIRYYNGAFDSATERVFDAQKRALERIRTVEPDAHVAYFPAEGKHVVHVWGRPLSIYAPTRGAALADALQRLKMK